MNNIILQHFDGELRELDKLSMANIQKYAKMVGAEYKLITGKPFRKHLTSPCQKVHMLDQQFDEYDEVLMLDIDMFVPKGMTVNVFDEVGVGLYNPIQQNLHRKLARSYPFHAAESAPYWGGAIYKMPLLMRKCLREQLGGDEHWMSSYNQPYHFEDEGIFHTLAYRAGYLKNDNLNLDPRWCYDNYLEDPASAGMIHIRTKVTPSGPKREKIVNYQALVDQGIISN